jgi:hypothetical protein
MKEQPNGLKLLNWGDRQRPTTSLYHQRFRQAPSTLSCELSPPTYKGIFRANALLDDPGNLLK